jgi:hypothetical protein
VEEGAQTCRNARDTYMDLEIDVKLSLTAENEASGYFTQVWSE